ncbi:hypothetical protein [Actinacidiphila sp. ITFR-21]|uniref:hypothetical protein n=1 Tax=Actinacidiphila sp. ITFR-21 TaxID=3075199 RepID=UPI002889811B|nr:hypothetical protein [Streptomyces sp. ITFR-21]WNI16038.1 hypothetical protein RLT57_11205 [Streptomyces sp. ITFR-21]
MIAGGSWGRWPARDATVVRYGLRETPASLAVSAVFVLVGAVAIWAADYVEREPLRWVFIGLAVPVAVVGLVTIPVTLSERHYRFVIDGAGWWWFHDGVIAFVPWDSLAAAGIYYTAGSAETPRVATLELFPRGPFDPDQPLLWETVRDGDPPAPGLPRLRYRIKLTRLKDFLSEVEAACVRWAPPELWFGRREQPEGYVGRPDRAGHRRRFREGTAAAQERPAGAAAGLGGGSGAGSGAPPGGAVPVDAPRAAERVAGVVWGSGEVPDGAGAALSGAVPSGYRVPPGGAVRSGGTAPSGDAAPPHDAVPPEAAAPGGPTG